MEEGCECGGGNGGERLVVLSDMACEVGGVGERERAWARAKAAGDRGSWRKVVGIIGDDCHGGWKDGGRLSSGRIWHGRRQVGGIGRGGVGECGGQVCGRGRGELGTGIEGERIGGGGDSGGVVGGGGDGG